MAASTWWLSVRRWAATVTSHRRYGEAVVLEMLPLVQILVFDEGVPARGKAVHVEEVI
jgi:hypothetical protein